MTTARKKYDSTVARIAGNLLSGIDLRNLHPDVILKDVEIAVATARAIVMETERTEVVETVDRF